MSSIFGHQVHGARRCGRSAHHSHDSRLGGLHMSLVSYLVRVDTSPKEARAFRTNPRRAMQLAGLSKKHQAALISRNPELIRRFVTEEKPLDISACKINRLISPI